MYKERTETCKIRLATALSIRKMTQRELCDRAGVPKSSLSLYLSGAYEPKQNRIYSMAVALNVSEAWLMGYDVPMEREPKQNNTPDVQTLTEGEKLLIELFRQIPEDSQKMYIEVLRAALRKDT